MLVLRFYAECFKRFQTPFSLPNQEKQTEEDVPGHAYTESRQHPASSTKCSDYRDLALIILPAHPGCVRRPMLSLELEVTCLYCLGPQKTSTRLAPGLTVL